MAKKEQINEATAIENLNDTLTKAGSKFMEKRKLFYWFIGGVIGIGAIILAWVFFYQNPKSQAALSAWQTVTEQNDSTKAGLLKKVAQEHGSFAGGNLASIEAAESYYKIGNYKECLNCLDMFSTSEPQMKTLAATMKGDCYANLNQLAKAHSAYAEALKAAKGNPMLAPYVLNKEASVYEAEKNYKKALECWQEINKEYPEYSLGEMNPEYFIEYYSALAAK